VTSTSGRRPVIAWLPGDGIGPEVMAAARTVLDASGFDAEYIEADVGWEFWKREGEPLPARTLQVLRTADAALFGAITSRPDPEAQEELEPALRGKDFAYRSPIVRMRQELRLNTKLVHAHSFAGNPRNHREGIDLWVVRENSEDLYSGIELHPVPQELREALRRTSPGMKRFDDTSGYDLAIACRVVTRDGAKNIARRAFELARRQGMSTVTIVEKPNVLRETSGLMIAEARRVAAEFPGIRLEEVNVDAMMMSLVKDPGRFGVIVSSNLFGDILSDLCAELAGGIGLVPTANLGEKSAVFEPAHGSAPKYAGQDVANPVATILSAAMMLEWLEHPAAEAIRHAVEQVIAEGSARTRDLGGWSGTREMAETIAGVVARERGR
jgi:isocitrate/isopropylmalate dehydrogenase